MLSLVRLFAILWTVAHQAPLSMGFSKQEYWSGLPCPPQRDLPHLGIELVSSLPPALAGRLFYHWATWEAHAFNNGGIQVKIGCLQSTSIKRVLRLSFLCFFKWHYVMLLNHTFQCTPSWLNSNMSITFDQTLNVKARLLAAHQKRQGNRSQICAQVKETKEGLFLLVPKHIRRYNKMRAKEKQSDKTS